jgi:nucleotide-binding universal stress UspA family protein
MRVLCCLDGTNIETLRRIITDQLKSENLVVGLIYVIDDAPRKEIERTRERLLRPLHLSPEREAQIAQSELSTAQEILQEGKQYFPEAELLQRAGRPEREIVLCGVEWNADIILICPRSPGSTGPPIGPKSIGHVARFVLDHASCPVLLARPVQKTLTLPPPPEKKRP